MASIAEALALAVRHHQSGALAEAEQLYREILRVDPGQAHALHLLGVVACQTGRLIEAVGYMRQSLARDPMQAETHSNLGIACYELGRLDEAVACYREALLLKPGYAEAHNNLGNALRDQGRLDDAVASYCQALRLKPGYVDAHNNLGAAFQEQGRLDEAVASFREALRLKPDYAEAHNNLGIARRKQGRLDEAAACSRQALLLKPGYADAHSNLGHALREQGRLDEAVACYRQALRLKPGSADAHTNLGVAFHDQGRPDEAIACYRQGLLLKSDDADGHYNQSLAFLLKGDFEQGWAEYEWRYRSQGTQPRPFPQPRWDGSPLAGRTLLLHAEQGLGDTLQFIRYAARTPRDGGRVVVECQPPLVRLLAGLPHIDQVVPRGAPLPDFDVQAPLPSLAGIFGTTLASIPADVPYLAVDAELVERWRRELEPLRNFKVGIAWQGNPENKADRRRSVALARFAALAEVAGVSLCSLQVGPGVEQLAEASFAIHDLGSRFKDFADAAAVVRNLDLVVCVDTALAHLAGALGKPVWLALPFTPDWRWLLSRPDSPWYPSMRLFRQERLGDWDGVFARLADALRHAREGWAPRESSAEALALALLHHKAGALAQAEQLYRQILQGNPSQVDALHLLGVLACQTGRHELGVASLRQSLTLQPQQPEACFNLGNALCQQGRLDEAVASYRQAVLLKPDYAEAHNNLGNALREQGRLDESVACLRQTLLLKPSWADAHNNLGIAFLDQGQLEDAVACYREAVRLNPGHVEAHFNMGNALRNLGRLDEAVASYRQALLLKPGCADAHINLGIAFQGQGRLEDAVACYLEGPRLKPGSAEAHLNLGVARQEQGRLDEAVASYRQALLRKSDSADAHSNLSQALLLQGDFEQGWPEYEWRLLSESGLARPFGQPRWDGSPLAGRTLLLHAEQGLGDTLQFIRYAARAPRDGGRVVVECQPPLMRLLAGLPHIDRVVPRGEPLPDFDVQAPLPSLPGIFHTTLASIPADVPYLAADADLVEHWRCELAPVGGFKVGIVWQGNPGHKGDRNRSVPLARFAALAEVAGVSLCSLQVGAGAEQLAQAHFAIHDLGTRFQDFADAAAAVRNLDLIVCVDTAVAHLAGALGKPVWVALPFAPDWRWLLGRQDSPWYPTMRLFRQERLGDWDGVFARLADALRQFVLESR